MRIEQPTEKSPALDTILWVLVVAIVAAVPVLNSMYVNESLFYRVLGGLVLAIVAVFVATRTSQGGAFWHVVKGSRAEIRRVVWPTQSERNKATLMVVAVIALMAVVLWALDGLFGWIAGLLLG